MTEAWTAPQVERTDPGRILGERQALEAWLAGQRGRDWEDTILGVQPYQWLYFDDRPGSPARTGSPPTRPLSPCRTRAPVFFCDVCSWSACVADRSRWQLLDCSAKSAILLL